MVQRRWRGATASGARFAGHRQRLRVPTALRRNRARRDADSQESERCRGRAVRRDGQVTRREMVQRRWRGATASGARFAGHRQRLRVPTALRRNRARRDADSQESERCRGRAVRRDGQVTRREMVQRRWRGATASGARFAGHRQRLRVPTALRRNRARRDADSQESERRRGRAVRRDGQVKRRRC